MTSILIKLSGEVFSPLTSYKTSENPQILFNIAKQIKKLQKTHSIGIVVGAGNILRGDKLDKSNGIKITTAHNAGMLSTIINGILLKDILQKENIESQVFSAISCPQIVNVINQEAIEKNICKNNISIFTGGTGNPFFTTDTNAVLRAIQVGAKEVWKGTNVDGVYNCDPKKEKNAKLLKKVTYQEVIEQNLNFMDLTAITLAKQHHIKS